MKMWGQTDLKKLVAYATIQEMGLVYLTLCFGDTTSMIGGFIFSVTHALLSSIFFFLVDTVSRRFYTRNIVEINGILHLAPNLGIVILISCIFYSGLPGTLKFISELYIFAGLFDITPLSTIIVLFGANFFGLIGFSKVWYNVVFGMTSINKNYTVNDLSSKELYTLSLCYFILLL
jgi:NADH:ubiquinone oxidoreductase subunit 4 (subunit M)